jgi:crotonobetainyl-CoA:carnitine CoA-transferase CaiB-like acyl-CoA transferase
MSAPKIRPLDGVLVLDFSQFLAGPVAAMRLADLGARVIKIERPGTGDIGRTLAFAGRMADGDTISFHAMNRNKESITADLKVAADLDYVKQLVAKADVIIQNFRPGVMERIGLDYESVRAINPSIVYASATGYGDEGPWKNRPGQDLLAQSVSGLPWLNGSRDDGPVPVGLSIADHLLSCHIAQGATASTPRTHSSLRPTAPIRPPTGTSHSR